MIWKKSLLLVFGFALSLCTWAIGATPFALGVLLGLGMIVAAFRMGHSYPSKHSRKFNGQARNQ